MTLCDCKETCVRWGVLADGSGGYFCPYIPGGTETKCRKTADKIGEHLTPTTIEKIDI